MLVGLILVRIGAEVTNQQLLGLGPRISLKQDTTNPFPLRFESSSPSPRTIGKSDLHRFWLHLNIKCYQIGLQHGQWL